MAASKRPTDRRERLLAAGVREFTRGSYEEVSTERIAELAGVAQGLLFHYFKTKRNFWEQVMRRVIDEQEMALADNTHRDPARWLREELELFLFGLTEFPPSQLTSGPGINADHLAILDARQEQAARRIIERMGIVEPAPLLYVAMRGWVGFSLSAGRKWLAAPAVSRAQILSLLTASLHDILEQVAALDPGAVDPAFFRSSSRAKRSAGSRASSPGVDRPSSGEERAAAAPES
jgi:AcrR family transcriptional regulator